MLTLIKMKDKNATDDEQPIDENQEHKSQLENEDVDAEQEDNELDGNEEKIATVEEAPSSVEKAGDDDSNAHTDVVEDEDCTKMIEGKNSEVANELMITPRSSHLKQFKSISLLKK